MAKSLSPDQIEERRKNLAFIRENIMDTETVDEERVFGDHLFTTTLVMQEEWLATVDALQAARAKSTDDWDRLFREMEALAGRFLAERGEAREEVKVWHDLYESEGQRLAETTQQLAEAQRDANILRGLRTQKCLLGDRLGRDGPCTNFWRTIELYCAPCYLRAIHKEPDAYPVFDHDSEAWRAQFEARPTDITEIELHYISMDEPNQEDDEEALKRDGVQRIPFEKLVARNVQGPVIEEYRGGIPKMQAWAGKEPLYTRSSAEVDRLAGVSNCPTCGAGDETFVDGDCPKCNPVSCEDSGQGHVWVKMGKAGLSDRGLSVMEWGDTKCLRCGIPAPVPDFDELDFVGDEIATHHHDHFHYGAGIHGHAHELSHHSTHDANHGP